MLTLRQMMVVTPKDVFDRAKGVAVSRSKIVNRRVKVWGHYELHPCLETVTRTKPDTIREPYRYHKNSILWLREVGNVPVEKRGLLSRGYLQMSCDCEFFCYHCEVALNKQGAAIIKYSNGEPPLETNPREVPYLCKHLVAIGYQVLRKGL